MSDMQATLKRIHKRLKRRKKRVRKFVFGIPERPRMTVYRSNRHIYVQIVNDVDHKTITGCSTLSPVIREKLADVTKSLERSKIVGEHIAELAKDIGIVQVVFDRNGRKYHGRVKALADGARAGGLKF
ncbi:MAG: 50S ribosomal protein L18 [Candidatus Electryoneaceae bacterium]|nr:50S ribosomal protein L18 [Candidatus Electryoneaceae bacterium]